MILKGAGSRNIHWASLFLSILAVLLLLSFVIYSFFSSNSPIADNTNLIYCDAERVEEGQFITGIHQFSRGDKQSNDFSRSGQFSCKIPTGEGTQYGFSYTLEDLIPGTTYKVNVWRKKNIYNSGYLIVQARGTDGFYKRTNEAIDSKDGWELLELRFFIPYQKKIDNINIHVLANGTQEVFFDDLSIEKINHWEATDFQPEVLHLSISEEGFNKLKEKRDQAIEAGILESADDDWVQAAILKDSTDDIPVRLRLKGDWLDHLVGDKWSFRVQVEDAFAWKRMKTFSLHTPAARNYLQEWLLHKLWEKEDVLTPRYDFVELQLNGQSLGIYAYEEHFEKQLVEYKKRREGPILKFSESGYWSGVKRSLEELGYVRLDSDHSAMNPANSDIQAFKEKRIALNPTLAQQFEQAQNLMLQFREGQERVTAVFDLSLLAKYYAICDVLNAYHGIVWHNLRFYFNPVTNRLEPIGFDGYGEKPAQQLSILGQGALHQSLTNTEDFTARLFRDQAFVAAYVNTLNKISGPNFNQFLEDYYADWQLRLEWLQMEFPKYQPNWNELSQNAAFVHSLILPFEDQSLKTFTQFKDAGQKHVVVKNTHNLPIEIIGYGLKKNRLAEVFDQPLLLAGHTSRRLLSRLNRDSIGKIDNFDQLRFQESVALAQQQIAEIYPLKITASAQYLFFRPLGLDTVFTSRINNWPAPNAHKLNQTLFEDSKIQNNPLLVLSGNQVTIPSGKYSLEKDIIIPDGYQVYIEAGTELTFEKGISFLSRSPVQMHGTEEAPIILRSLKGEGAGFAVMQTKEPSSLQYVIFDGLNTLQKKGWTLTGAVTFYEADVNLNRCVFKNIPCEDALNTVRSNFKMEYCRFTNVSFDAFDSDFCKGEILNSTFQNVGNDGIDFSGSIVNIKNCQMLACRDKGISVGEETDARVFKTRIEACPIAMASKDLSVLYVEEVDLLNCDQAFVAFEKKAEFGGSKIIVKNYTADNIKRLHAISEGCTLQLKDVLIKGK